jgi:hypothetical protein
MLALTYAHSETPSETILGGAAWVYLLLVFLNRGTRWNNPVLRLVAILVRRKYGRPVEHLCLMACGH